MQKYLHEARAAFFDSFCQSWERSALNSEFVLLPAPCRARKTMSVGVGKGFNRKNSLTTRLILFLCVARLTFFFATITPSRDCDCWEFIVKTMPDDPPALTGSPSKTALKACLSRSLCCFWNELLMGVQPTAFYAERRRRPRARRRAKTLRPFFVAIRARKPWLRLRFRTLGWNVRFMLSAFSRQSWNKGGGV